MLVRTLLSAWVVAISFAISAMMARHSLPSVRPSGLAEAAKAAAERTAQKSKAGEGSVDQSSELLGVHILDPRCSCSRRVIERLGELLAERKGESGVRHVAFLLSEPNAKLREALRQAKLDVLQSDAETAHREFKIETVPWLVVLNDKLDVLYSGGYAPGAIRGREDLKIDEIFEAARDRRRLASLPSFGCVTSQALRNRLLAL